MGKYREQLLQSLECEIAKGPRSDAHVELFRFFYIQPPNVQINGTKWAMRRFLPIYLQNHPQRGWAHLIIEQTENWLKQHGRTVPELAAETEVNPEFDLCFHALLIAAEFQSSPLNLTSSCAFAIDQTIRARMVHLWRADNPEAVRESEEFKQLSESEELIGLLACQTVKYESYLDNAAAIAIHQREWVLLLAWLRETAQISGSPDWTQLNSDLAIWREHEYWLIAPSNEAEGTRE